MLPFRKATPSAFGCHPFTREGELPERDVLIPLYANQSQLRESPLSIFEENGEGPGVGLKPQNIRQFNN
jgi:hypothetical protein